MNQEPFPPDRAAIHRNRRVLARVLTHRVNGLTVRSMWKQLEEFCRSLVELMTSPFRAVEEFMREVLAAWRFEVDLLGDFTADDSI